MNENDLNFNNWWWLDQEKKRLERNKRVKLTRIELATKVLELEAYLREHEAREQAQKIAHLHAQGQRPKHHVGCALVRDLGLEEKVLRRSFVFNRASVDGSRVALSVSSDEPYERTFGIEVLDHSPKSIRMRRMLDGAPLLFNHNPDSHLGTILNASTDGKKLRVHSKFGSSELAQQKLQDIRDGILKKASIGYVIHNMVEERKGRFRATDWEPYEASLVTLPADSSVGIEL